MAHNVPKLLKTMLEAGPFTQAQLASRLSTGKSAITQPQISRWMKGQDPERPNYERIVEVAKMIGVISDMRSEDVADGLSSPPPPRMVKIKGYVGASGEAVYYRVSDEYLEEVEAPDGASDQTVAVQVRGDSLGPVFDSWNIFYDDIRSPITEDLIGQLCVVGLADDRILVKRLLRQGGEYVLRSNSGDPDITDAVIEWAAKVTNMRPR